MAYSTVFWSAKTIANEARRQIEYQGELQHISSNWFQERGIQPGDRLFVVGYARGRLQLIFGFDVEEYVAARTVQRRLGYWPYKARDHILGTARAVNFSRTVANQYVRKLRFYDGSEPKFASDGSLAKQAFRGSRGRPRQLDAPSGQLLNRLLRISPPTASADASGKSFKEGQPRTVPTTRYDRSRAARLRCIEIHGTACYACKMSFADTYGEIGDGYIHVHHRKEFVGRHRPRQTDPKRDLIPICPNCHAMLHSTRPAMTPDTLRSHLSSRRVLTSASGRSEEKLK